jgi:hypothetical protein
MGKDEAGVLTLWIRRLKIMLGQNYSQLTTIIFLGDAKNDDAHFVCTRFQKVEDERLCSLLCKTLHGILQETA